MKKTLFFSTIILGLLFTACSKSNSTPAVTNPIVGLWIGTYEVTYPSQPTDTLYYSFDIRADSSILAIGLGADGNTYYSSGTWSLSGTAFSAHYTGLNLSNTGAIQNATATYSSTTGILSSGLITSPGVSLFSTFTLNRVN